MGGWVGSTGMSELGVSSSSESHPVRVGKGTELGADHSTVGAGDDLRCGSWTGQATHYRWILSGVATSVLADSNDAIVGVILHSNVTG